MFKSIILPVFLAVSFLHGRSQNTYNEISLPRLLPVLQQGPGDHLLLDVRTRGEYHDSLSSNKHLNIGRIRGAVNIPMHELQQDPEALQSLNDYKDKDIYVICSHSYRSRTISNLLLKNGFTRVTNIQGGMSEWYRNFGELQPFAAGFLEKKGGVSMMAPAQLFQKLRKKEAVVLIGFANAPRTNFDSVIRVFYSYFPEFPGLSYVQATDSAAVMDRVRAAAGKTIVTFNTIGAGAVEMAGWLTKSGIPDVHYLVGNILGFFEYLVNYEPAEKTGNYLTPRSQIRFYSAPSLCRELDKGSAMQLIDLRHDTLFAKTTSGTKLSYRQIKGAINFPYYESADVFSRRFPDKQKEYVLLGHQGYTGLELADALLQKGYRVGWLIGGNERWEWYTNNVPGFSCTDYFIR